MRVAIVGGGWAGMAAAVTAAGAGHRVIVFEAARRLGGRARALPGTLPDGRAVLLDNGQHILIGAYRETLRLMRQVGVLPEQALLRLPLALVFADCSGLALRGRGTPRALLAALVAARGWGARDKLALLRFMLAWRQRGFRCAEAVTVAELGAPLTPRLRRDFLEPLCVAALNTPTSRASGQVLLRVLQDSLWAERGGSDLLLPRVDLGALFPEPAARWLQAHGGEVRLGERVTALRALPAAGAASRSGCATRRLRPCSRWRPGRVHQPRLPLRARRPTRTQPCRDRCWRCVPRPAPHPARSSCSTGAGSADPRACSHSSRAPAAATARRCRRRSPNRRGPSSAWTCSQCRR